MKYNEIVQILSGSRQQAYVVVSQIILHIATLIDIRGQYEDVSLSDYDDIMDCLESDGYRKTWNRCVPHYAVTCSQVTNNYILTTGFRFSQDLNF